MIVVETIRASEGLTRSNKLLHCLCRASFDERARKFRFLCAWFQEKNEQKPCAKGFNDSREAKSYFKEIGISEDWYVIHDQEEPRAITILMI